MSPAGCLLGWVGRRPGRGGPAVHRGRPMSPAGAVRGCPGASVAPVVHRYWSRRGVVHRSRLTLAGRPAAEQAAGMTSTPFLTAVVGASGGLGASTLALAVGRRLAATGPPAVVVDLDLLRGGLEVTAGVEHLPGPAVGRPVPRPGPGAARRPGVDAARRGGLRRAVGPWRRTARGAGDGSARRRRLPRPGVGPGGARPAAQQSGASGCAVPGGTGRRGRRAAHARPGRCRCRGVAAPRRAGCLGPRARRAHRHPGRTGRVRRGRRGRRAPRRRPPAPPPDDPHVPRDAERGLFPGTGRDAVRRCADAVVAAVDAVAEAS